jgi:hypothetical protein
MDSQLKAIEKVLNTLGKRLAKNFYDLDLNFTVTGTLEDSPDYSPKLMVSVETDKKVPNVLRRKNQGWNSGRYSTLEDLQYNLGNLFKYIGTQDIGLILNPEQLRVYQFPPLDKQDYVNNPNKFTPLVDETYLLDNETGWFYILYKNDVIDVDNDFHISDVDSEKWWSELKKEDKMNLDRLYK